MLVFSKENFAKSIVFEERAKTLLFLSMGLRRPITIMFLKGYIDEAIFKTGIVKGISPGVREPEWKRIITGSFRLDTDENTWIEISEIYAVSFAGEKEPVLFIKHRDTLISLHNLESIYGGQFGRTWVDIDLGSFDDSKYYRILCEMAGAKFGTEQYDD